MLSIYLLRDYHIEVLLTFLTVKYIGTPIYKFVIKLQQYNVITSTYYNTVNKYISKKNKTIKNKSNILLTDTTLISNKLGIDNIGYNPQHPKHKVSKVSLTVSTIHVRISYHRRKWYSVDG